MWIPFVQNALFASLVTVFGAVSSTVPTSQCDEGYFYSVYTLTCIQCSSCPIDQIIRTPCGRTTDTLCGAFLEFDQFHFGSSRDKQGNKIMVDKEAIYKKISVNADENAFTDRHSTISTTNVKKTDTDRQQVQFQTRKNGEQWRTLALSLIGVLSVVCLFLVIFIIVACQLKRRQSREKEITYDPELHHPSKSRSNSHRYVSSRDRLKIPTNVESDSEDSAGNPVRRHFRLPAIMRPESTSDAESTTSQPGTSAQASSTTDYVYFRAPNNGNDVP